MNALRSGNGYGFSTHLLAASTRFWFYGKSMSGPKTLESQTVGLSITAPEVAAICDPQNYVELPLAA